MREDIRVVRAVLYARLSSTGLTARLPASEQRLLRTTRGEGRRLVDIRPSHHKGACPFLSVPRRVWEAPPHGSRRFVTYICFAVICVCVWVPFYSPALSDVPRDGDMEE
jgi:hypothetical protein